MKQKNANQRKKFIIISILFLLFLIPAFLARVFYHNQAWLPKHRLNHGQLITPALSVKDLKLDPQLTEHRWVLLFLQAGDCQEDCQKSLYSMQQIQRALGKDMNRLQRVVLTPVAQGINKSFEEWLNTGKTRQWSLAPEDFATFSARSGFWYVVDPLGNIILNYPKDANPEAILDDLKYLMGVSNIG